MEHQKNLPHLFINRVNFEGTKCLKLFFYDNEAIKARIRQNDWIQYSMELAAYYTVDYGNTIAILQDVFDDVAYVNLTKLDWKRFEISRKNIGTPTHYRELQIRKGFESIVLFPFETAGRQLIGFKHHFKRPQYIEVMASGFFSLSQGE